MARKTFKLVDGSIAHNFKELALLLGVEKVTREDISEGGQYSDLVTVLGSDDAPEQEGDTPASEEGSDTENVETKDEDIDTEGGSEDDSENDNTDTENTEDTSKEDVDEVDKSVVYTTVDESDLEGVSKEEILESIPKFKDLQDLKNFIKDIDTPTLEFMARGIGLTWSPTYHASIHRMRIALAMQRYFFPELFVPKESGNKSKYGNYTTADLEKLAKENKVKWSKTSNERINRMKLITALKSSGFLPQ